MTAVADAAHPIVAMVVAIAVAFAADEEGKGREALVNLTALANVHAGDPDLFEVAAYHLYMLIGTKYNTVN